MKTFSIAGLQLELNHNNNKDLVSQNIIHTVKRYPWVNMIVVSELAIGGSSRSEEFSLDKNLEVFKSMKRHLPLIVYRDIEKRIKCRDLVYNLEEETNFLTVNNRNNIVMYRDLLDISLPEEYYITHLKIKKD